MTQKEMYSKILEKYLNGEVIFDTDKKLGCVSELCGEEVEYIFSIENQKISSDISSDYKLFQKIFDTLGIDYYINPNKSEHMFVDISEDAYVHITFEDQKFFDWEI